MHDLIERLESRLCAIESKIDNIAKLKGKSLEWMGQLAQQVGSLDAFREEVRASFEPLFCKLEGMDEVMRILRHATSDVSRRVEQLEKDRIRKAG